MTGPAHFAYTGVSASGERVADVVAASSRHDALRRLEREGIAVLSVRPRDDVRLSVGLRRRGITDEERILVLRQVATMTRAGVTLLEALEAVAEALAERPVSDGVRSFADGLRRGEPIEAAFRNGLPGYPDYVYALVATGAAAGRMPAVLDEASQHLAFEIGLRRDLAAALAYPALLVGAAVVVFLFLFSAVVPRFVVMVGDRRAEIGGLGRAVLDLGAFFAQAPLLAFACVLAPPAALAMACATAEGRRTILRGLSWFPGVAALASARARAMWARVMSFALSAGVGMAKATELSIASAAPGPFRDALARGNRAMRDGAPVHEAFGAERAFDPIDRSLLRAGEKSGAFAPMFAAIAERHEENLRRRLKLVVILLEQAAIAFVALSIGAVVISLVTAITTLYDTIGAG